MEIIMDLLRDAIWGLSLPLVTNVVLILILTKLEILRKSLR